MEQFPTNTSIETKKETTMEIAQLNSQRWQDALGEDAKTIARLYGPESTFLPTVSPDFKKGPGEAAEYFTHFLEKNPSCKIIEEQVRPLGENSYLHYGKYDFEIGPSEQRQMVEAEFSFVWEKNEDNQWEIIHHHSSIKPSEKEALNFKNILEKNTKGEIIEEQVQHLGPDKYLQSGLQNFIIGPEDAQQIIEARFSFIWEKNKDGAWEITHNHSSMKPKQE
jgi:uncharacterized protein (TIGR02246 family)